MYHARTANQAKSTTWNTRGQAERYIARQVVAHFDATGARTLDYSLWSTGRSNNVHLGAAMTLSRARNLLGLS